MKNPLILLEKEKIESLLTPEFALKVGSIDIYETISSTNDYLKTLARSEKIDFCLTEHQTAGRGRHGRNWHSPFGSNIYLSCRWCISQNQYDLNGLSLVIGLAIITALKEYGVAELSIKWPNDILWKNKKLAGILTETQHTADGLIQIIIGLGINVNMSEVVNATIEQPWASIATITGTTQDRNPIVALVINNLLKNLSLFRSQSWTAFYNQWQQYDALNNCPVQFKTGSGIVEGIVRGVNHQGHLLIEKSNGQIATYSSGEVSMLRPNLNPAITKPLTE